MPTLLITGANRGLGLGLAREFLDDQWRVIAVVRSVSPELEGLAGDRLEIHHCPLTDDDRLNALAQSLSERTIDVLLNNAGRMMNAQFTTDGGGGQGFGTFDREVWRDVFDINLFTPMKLAELLLPQIRRSDHGRIVTISSMLGSMAMNTFGGIYAYRASKAGVNAIMKSMAVDLESQGITAIALHPGWVQTDMGGPGADLEIETSVTGMKRVIQDLRPEDSGKFLSWDGSEMPW
jgi:NAD(P)-dependent dehydrogenase (short-subunit alcohol dehydrogenase family)